MSVCPRVVSLQKIRPESYRWCRIMWLRKHWWFNGLVLFGYASPFSKAPCTHHRVTNSKFFCATTDPAGSPVFLQSGGGFILFAALTALLSYENTRVWGQRDSQGDFFFSVMKTPRRVLVMFLLEDFFPSFLRAVAGAVWSIWHWMLGLIGFPEWGYHCREDWAALLTLALIPPIEISSFVMLQLRCVNPLDPSRHISRWRLWRRNLAKHLHVVRMRINLLCIIKNTSKSKCVCHIN